MAFTTFAYVFFIFYCNISLAVCQYITILSIYGQDIHLFVFCAASTFIFLPRITTVQEAEDKIYHFPCFCSSRTLAGTEVRILTPGAISCVPLPINSVRQNPSERFPPHQSRTQPEWPTALSVYSVHKQRQKDGPKPLHAGGQQKSM